MSGFTNKPKILRGAFVEYGLSIPPLFVVFQFNPVQLTRNRGLTYAAPSSAQTGGRTSSLRDFHKRYDDLTGDPNTQPQHKHMPTLGELAISRALR